MIISRPAEHTSSELLAMPFHAPAVTLGVTGVRWSFDSGYCKSTTKQVDVRPRVDDAAWLAATYVPPPFDAVAMFSATGLSS